MHREILLDFTDYFTMSVHIVKYIVKSMVFSPTFSRWNIEDKRKGVSCEGGALCCMPDFEDQPHRAVSMGIICFFLDITPGRNTSLSLGSTEKAYLMVSSLPK